MVYHTDSFDYVVVVDNEAYDLEISIHASYEKLEIRPSSFGIVPSVKGGLYNVLRNKVVTTISNTDTQFHSATDGFHVFPII